MGDFVVKECVVTIKCGDVMREHEMTIYMRNNNYICTPYY